ncbi:hypothetical protein TNCV_2483421 [Trichonephila clavipes]|uniref:Uncharacterized protein n=1 Tax=Trichonephila clavipes TaxID=2585209 RepID=A0A8X6VZI9_TRICX|nr:hypothetical protein TNCV_2483421 [Trichonephila clavipes]
MGSSHVNITGNQIADAPAKDCAAKPTMNSATLTYSELHSTYINIKQASNSCLSLIDNEAAMLNALLHSNDYEESCTEVLPRLHLLQG